MHNTKDIVNKPCWCTNKQCKVAVGEMGVGEMGVGEMALTHDNYM